MNKLDKLIGIVSVAIVAPIAAALVAAMTMAIVAG